MDSCAVAAGLLQQVSPFRDPRITGYLLLPAAYRSLSRLSSALSAKASTLRSFCLTASCPLAYGHAVGHVLFILNEFMFACLSACAFLCGYGSLNAPAGAADLIRIHLGCLDILISLECFVLYAVFKVRSGDGEIRTLDPLLARQVLSQLSYTPINSGVHLLSHTVASIVPSAACVLTVVFGMGTSVSHRRIGTGKLPQISKTRQYGQPLLFSIRKEVIQPHLPIRLPCYDFTPVIRPAFGSSLRLVGSLTSGVADSHGVTGGVYKTRERIHRDMLIRDY